MTAFRKKAGAVILALGCMIMLCLGCLGSYSSAEDGGTLTLVCENKNSPVKNMPWTLFKVGSYVNGTIKAEGDFEKYRVDFGDMSAASLTDAAATLADYAFVDKLDYIGVKPSDNSGIVVFDNLDDGVYLAAAKKYKVNEVTYKGAPAFFLIDGGKSREVTGYPKFTTRLTLAGVFERLTVKKEWINADYMPNKPAEITVDIYWDYELYDTVVLSEKNKWTYSWEEEVGYEWTIIERELPPDCTVVYRNDGLHYVAANTYNPDWVGGGAETRPVSTAAVTSTKPTVVANDDETVTSISETAPVSGEGIGTTSFSIGGGTIENSTETVNSSTKTTPVNNGTSPKDKTPSGNGGNQVYNITSAITKLPQTGQLWWPVPLMAVGGFVLIAAGIRIILGSKREDNE